ncbi:Dig2p NDAI_0C05240 [Naumovozyma dairenensis CBS 421]|uniref:Uncharacterized protein n=1 Tax=Naumovozyma dairenensis (strain ATCC 10597 / BCRC 20456 / CBS 421 / NBRC 0211 / NRRL Y-12639) TaxID=1071378 RepID=G0W8S2_NAUDC|nr:hypothetical protein NDAI_0C05240 [Naumovozyma dairenensis CBS 421]CCD24183.1 hypothetical protein NDAI_0C05240 [Naumovozyma dairenensis CBS 421]
MSSVKKLNDPETNDDNSKQKTTTTTTTTTATGSIERQTLPVNNDNNKNIKQLGIQCISPGIQQEKLDDKKLSSITKSKDIEKFQRAAILKLANSNKKYTTSIASDLEQVPDGGVNQEQHLIDEDHSSNDSATESLHDQEQAGKEKDNNNNDDDDDDDDDDKDSTLEENDDNMQEEEGFITSKKRNLPLKNSNKSLKRKKIPSPLDLPGSNNSTYNTSGNSSTTSATHYMNDPILAQSAPAHTTQFRKLNNNNPQRITKPRVRYLGRVNTVATNTAGINRQQRLMQGQLQQFPFQSQQQQQQQQYLAYYQNSTPTGAISSLPMNPYMSPYIASPQYIPPPPPPPPQPRSAIMTPMMYHNSTGTQFIPYPRSALPYSMQSPYSINNTMTPAARNFIRPSSLKGNVPTQKKQEQAREQEENDENPDLAIEEDADSSPTLSENPVPSSVESITPQHVSIMQGEIRILRNAFGFEFPCNSDSIDKKLFLSICGKIWDESKELNKKDT